MTVGPTNTLPPISRTERARLAARFDGWLLAIAAGQCPEHDDQGLPLLTTKALPGTPAKIGEFCRRCAAGKSLFHPADANHEADRWEGDDAPAAFPWDTDAIARLYLCKRPTDTAHADQEAPAAAPEGRVAVPAGRMRFS